MNMPTADPMSPPVTSGLKPSGVPYETYKRVAPLAGRYQDRRSFHRRPDYPLRWRDYTPLQKLHRAGEHFSVANIHGQVGHTFTLKLAGNLQATLKEHADPVRLMANYISREFKKAGLPNLPFGFAFDVKDDILHLHGMVAFENEGQIPAAKRAFMTAGGKFPASQRARQVKLEPISISTGWVNYCTKDARNLERFLGKAVEPFLSREMIRLARGAAERATAGKWGRLKREALAEKRRGQSSGHHLK